MKTFRLSILLALSVLATTAASAQTRPAARPTTTAKPASTTTRTTTTTTKPAATAKPTATAATKPAAKPAPAAIEEPEAAPAKATAAPKKTAAKSSSSADNSEFGMGTIAANLGAGFGIGYSYYGSVTAMPALSLSVERGSIEGVGPGIIGIGALVGYKGYTYKYSYGNYKASWNNYMVAVRGTYHYNILEVPKLDTYAGLSLGVRVQTWKDTYWDSNPGYSGSFNSSSAYITSGIFAGARYMFTNNLGAFGELGYDMSYLKLGLTAKF